jgi:O-antigen/teichoic acid export membrane protein
VGFARQALWTYLVRIVLIPLGVINAIIVARWLGPSGQGTFAAVTAFVATAATVGSLGLSPAVTNTAASDPSAAPALLANARLTGFVSGVAACLALLGLHLATPGVFGEISFTLLLVAGIALPFSLTAAQFQAVALGVRRIRQYNFMVIQDRVLLLGTAIAVLVVLGRGVTWLVAGTTVIAAVKLATYDVMLRPGSARWRPDLRVLRGIGRLSIRAYLATLLAFLVLRSDIMLIHAMLDPASTGVYSVAVRVAELLLVLPAAIGTILFPKIAASDESMGAHFTAAVSRHTTLAVTVGCAVVGASAWWLIVFAFGQPYQGATVCLWILLPGIWCMSLQLIFANDLAGRDYPVFLASMWFVLLVVNVALNLLWLPWIGIAGAAASSTVAYVLSLGLLVRYWLRRFPEVRAVDLFVLRRDEWSTLPSRLRESLGSRPKDDPGSTP